jgi:carbon-monoxide dehydrogenase large subunit
MLLGIGVCAYVESTGAGPPMEFATVSIDCSGAVVVRTGSSPHGQGHETTWASLVERTIGIAAGRVSVVHGDTDAVAVGLGTFASRSTQFAGSAVVQAGEQLVRRARVVVAQHLEAAEADVEFDARSGTFAVAGTPSRSLAWRDVVVAAGVDEMVEDTMFSGAMTFPFGAHLAVVEVDRDTGSARVVRHVAVDDAGVIVNHAIAEGQIHGGIAQGIGQALYEEVRYDAQATPLTTNLADYAVPAATELPSFETAFTETAAPSNPLGAKGVGESGIIGSVAAVQNAVCDAVAHLGVDHIDIPLTPERVWRAIRSSSARRR